jgi:hypothetical protein
MLLALMASVAAPAGAASPLPSEKHWRHDVAHAMAGSRRYLHGVAAVNGVRLAINLDIDNTSLATRYRPGSPVLAVRAFARAAHRQGMAVLFNTGRLGSGVGTARTLLRRAGFPVTEMCGRSSRSEGLAQSKPRCRARFASEGYLIVANVGNNATDFSGPHDYGRAFRLPNYGGRLG